MEINQELYSTLIQMAWNEYSKGNIPKMAHLLQQSWEYSPYLKAETISDWLSKFSQFALQSDCEFDADYLSELIEWDSATSHVFQDRHTVYVFGKDREHGELSGEPVWLDLAVEPKNNYLLRGKSASDQPDATKQVLIQFEFLDRNKNLIPGPYESLSNSEKLGFYKYIPTKSPNLSSFEVSFLTPTQAHYVKIGFRTWYPKKPIFIESKLEVRGKNDRQPASLFQRSLDSFALPAKNHQLAILFAGHDLRFVKPIISRYIGDNFNVLIDKWQSHTKHDEAFSRKLLDQADIIVCEWCLGNAVWYSQNKKSNQKLFIRLHKQELSTDYPHQVIWKNVDSIVFIAPKMQESAIETFRIDTQQNLIFNCIDTNYFDLPKKDKCQFNIGLLGYVPKWKRPDIAVEVLLRLKAKDRRYRLFIKGKRPESLSWIWKKEEFRNYYEKIWHELKELDLEDSVIFSDYGADVNTWFQNIGFILSVSDIEGSHQAVAEGMASGAIPMISGGYYHKCGASLMYPQQYCCNDVDEIVGKIHDLSINEEKFLTWQKQAKSFSKKNFDNQLIFSQWDDLLFKGKQIIASTRQKNVLVYGKIDLNIIDGSSIWLTSIVNLLSSDLNCKVTLLLRTKPSYKACFLNIDHLNLIQLIDPFTSDLLETWEHPVRLSDKDAVDCISQLEKKTNFDSILIRGDGETLQFLKTNPQVLNKCIFYGLHDLNQEDVSTINQSKALAVQTPQLQQHYLSNGIKPEKTFVLPPMVKNRQKEENILARQGFNLVYSGKLSQPYNAVEIIKAFTQNLGDKKDYQLNLIVSKVHKSKDESYNQELEDLLKNHNDERIKIYRSLTRDAVYKIINKCDVGISWRSPELDDCLEISTKLLEYGSLAKPIILNRNVINESVVGKDYPLFANNLQEFCDAINRVFSDNALFIKASEMMFKATQEYMFDKVYSKIKINF